MSDVTFSETNRVQYSSTSFCFWIPPTVFSSHKRRRATSLGRCRPRFGDHLRYCFIRGSSPRWRIKSIFYMLEITEELIVSISERFCDSNNSRRIGTRAFPFPVTLSHIISHCSDQCVEPNRGQSQKRIFGTMAKGTAHR